jgi:[FeFe] hydrogenase H-cluster maturation GTPase HydF
LDTAGLNDNLTEIGKQRVLRTKNALKRCDIAVIITTATADNEDFAIANDCFLSKIPVLTVFNKSDIDKPSVEVAEKFAKLGETMVLSALDIANRDKILSEFKEKIIKIAPDDIIAPKSLLKNVIFAKNNIVLVVPLDIAAPKGRLILPQVQTLRDILDINAVVTLTQPNTYVQTLQNLKNAPDLVICDSQVVHFTAENTPENIPLTTFSIIFARNKGNLSEFVSGAEKISTLTPESKILIAEACSHHSTDEDIGKVKIPNMLKKYLNFAPIIDFCNGRDFPDTLADYDLVIHCGGCMLNRREMLVRMDFCAQNNVAITNYGVAISYLQGVLNKTVLPFAN